MSIPSMLRYSGLEANIPLGCKTLNGFTFVWNSCSSPDLDALNSSPIAVKKVQKSYEKL